MTDFTTHTLDEFLGALADRKPTPGGGAVAAATGALAAALARMVTAYSIGSKTPDAARTRLADLAAQLRAMDELQRALITQDATAYLAMTEAGRAARDNPEKQPAYQQTVLAAVSVPMEIAAVASRTLATLDDGKDVVGKYMVSDLAVASVVACAAVDAAGYLVRVNLPAIDDRSTRARIARDMEEVRSRSAIRRESIDSFVTARLEPHE